MKNAVKSTLALAMVAMLGVGMAGCGRVSKLVPETEGEYTFSIDSFNSLNGEENYMLVATKGTYIVVQSEEYDYQVIDVKNDRVLYTSEDAITIIDNGLFCSYDMEDETYTLYANNGSSTYADATIENNMFVDATTGARTYVDVNGIVKTEVNPFARILTYSDDAIKMGKKYVKMEDDGVLVVFDKNGEYERSVSAEMALGLSDDEEVEGYWFVDDTFFIQTWRELPEDAEDYDFINEGEKVDITTYSYNVRKNRVKTLKHFDYVVNDYEYSTNRSAILEVQKIEDEKLGAAELVQSFNESGKVYVDLQKEVPGANSFRAISEEVVRITDTVGDVHIFKDGKKLISVSQEQARTLVFVGGYAYKNVGENLLIYNLEKDGETTKITGVQQVTSYQGKIIYEQKESSTHKICVFDTKTAIIEEESVKKSQEVSFMGDMATVREDGALKKLVFFSANGMVQMDNVAQYQPVVGVSDSKEGMSYTVYKITDDEDDVSYQVIKRGYPVVKE